MVARFPEGVLQQAVDAECSCNGSKEEAARLIGINVNTFKHRLKEAKRLGLVPKTAPTATVPAAVASTIETLQAEVERLREREKQLEAAMAQAHRPHFTIRQELRGSASKLNVCAIGDGHDGPKLTDKRRFRLIGQHVRATRPCIMLGIGDFLTMDSLNTHIPNENYNGRAKPTFLNDMESGELAFAALDEGLNGYAPERHMTDGNHERRLYLFEDRAPEAYGMMQMEYDRLLQRHGFTHSPYGSIQYYGGVGFVHCALNTLGKSYGGKNCLPTIANDSITDLVIGHSHRGRVHSAPKIGQRYPTTILDLGCALPDGHVEDYATHALNGWTYGIYDLVIQHGHIQSAKFISMAELEERYAS